MSGINIPTCLWAQTKEAVYVTVDVPDVTDEKISVDANVLKFSAKSGGKQYECTMELFEPINAEESKYEVRGRNVFFSLKRAESEEEKDEVYWPRLLKDKKHIEYGKNAKINSLNFTWDKVIENYKRIL